MVRIGFIVEGASEKNLIKSPNFQNFLQKNGFSIEKETVEKTYDEEDLLLHDAEGGNNLKLPEKMIERIENLLANGATKIYVLTDLEDESDVQAVRERIGLAESLELIFVAVKAIEAWFLADDEMMKNWLNQEFHEHQPENTVSTPWDRMGEIAEQHQKRFPPKNRKMRLIRRFIEEYHFDIERAAQHPNCPSAKELVAHFQNKVSQQ